MGKAPKMKATSRELNKFTANWKCGDKYTSQKFQWRINYAKGHTSWQTEKVSATATSKSVTIPWTKTAKEPDWRDFFPYKKSDGSYKPKVKAFRVRVRGKRKKNKKWTAYKYKNKTISVPTNKQITSATFEQSDTGTNVSKFTMKLNINDKSNAFATHVQFQTAVLDTHLNNLNERQVKWQDVSTDLVYRGDDLTDPSAHTLEIYDRVRKTSYDTWGVYITDTDSHDGSRAFTRYIRARLVGPAGNASGWIQRERVFGAPNKPYDISTVLTKNGANGYKAITSFKCVDIVNVPISYATISYCFAQPNADGEPVNPSWSTDGPKIIPKTRVNTSSSDEKLSTVVLNESNTRYSGEFFVSEISSLKPDVAWNTWVRTNDVYIWDASTDQYNINGTIGEDQFLYVMVTIYCKDTSTSTSSDAVMAVFKDGSSGSSTVLKQPTLGTIIISPEGELNTVQVTVTNNCSIEGSYLVLQYLLSDKSMDIAVFDESGTYDVNVPSINFGTYELGLYAAYGEYDEETQKVEKTFTATVDGELEEFTYDEWTLTPTLSSKPAKEGGIIPTPPTNIIITNKTIADSVNGKVEVSWNWSWKDGNITEISWSTDKDAWKSNGGYESYQVYRYDGNSRIINNLDIGELYYFRLRHIKSATAAANSSDGNASIWSEAQTIEILTAPNSPQCSFSPSTIVLGSETLSKTTLSWVYVTTDKSSQSSATIARCNENGVIDSSFGYITLGGKDEPYTSQSYIFDSSDENLDFKPGESYYFCMKVRSENGIESEKWSDPAKLTVVEQLTCKIDREDENYPFSEGYDADGELISQPVLKTLPMTISVLGSGVGVHTEIHIERTDDYEHERPDGRIIGGYIGEIVYDDIQEANGVFSIEPAPDLLNDDGEYKLVAYNRDDYGQVATDEIDFVVKWEHQALMPFASVQTNKDEGVVYITIGIPTNGEIDDDDYCEIYRLSADGYKLIADNCQFGVTYVDPYPTIGVFGGHRIVYRTKNGDFTLANGDDAWLDFEIEEFNYNYAYSPDEYVLYNGKVYKCNYDITESEYWNPYHWDECGSNCDYITSLDNIIDYDGGQVLARYNIDISNAWAKDFQETKYLGGSVQGDWSTGVSRTGSINAEVVATDSSTIRDFRDLAAYAGVCHVRTTDGSNYYANVEVNESLSHSPGLTRSYSLSFSRVDDPGLDAEPYDEYYNIDG